MVKNILKESSDVIDEKKIQEIESKWQKKWKENKIYESNPSNNKKYFITVAYPYANSAMHIGHGRTFTMADILARIKRQEGYNVLYPMGFHISGTPVLAVADNIARGDEKQIKQTMDAISDYISDENEKRKLIESFKDPYNIAKFFSSKIEETFDEIGLSIDWRRQFSTGDKTYQKFIEWQFKKLHEEGILVQDKYPILYSPADENAVGEDDIKDGDTDKVTVSEMTYILFKIVDEDLYFPAATLRPDALFGTTNLWLDTRWEYYKVKVNGKNWIVTKEALLKIKYQFDDVENEEKIDNVEKYLNKKAIVPIINREVPIIKANFVDPDHGTGIVYSSPAGSVHDYLALEKAKKEGVIDSSIDVINTVYYKDKKGNILKSYSDDSSCPAKEILEKYNIWDLENPKLEDLKQELYKEEHYNGYLNEKAGEFKDVPISKAKELIRDKLIELELGGVFYETSRKAITRAGNKIIVANLRDQWFLDYRSPKTKEKAYAVLDNLDFKPEKLRATQKYYIDWASMRPCARKRGIGTPLFLDKKWVIESLSDSTIYQMLYLIHHKIKENNLSPEQLTEEFFDFVLLGKGDVSEVSKDTEIDENLILDMRKEVEYWQNLDVRYTNEPHMSNHLNFLIYHYGIIFPQKNWPKNITIGGLMIKDGAKISKSKGNGIPLIRVKRIYGIDLYRLYIILSSNYDVQMDFREEDIEQLRKKFNKLKEILFDSTKHEKPKYEDLSSIDKWLVSKFYHYARDFFNLVENYKFRDAYVNIIYEMLSNINYHQRRTNYENTLKVIRFILEDYLHLLNPVIPHITEELYELVKENKDEFLSISPIKKENFDNYIDEEAMAKEDILLETISNIAREIESRKDINITKVKIVVSPIERYNLFDKISVLLKETKDFKKIMGELMRDFGNDKKFISKFVPKTLGSGLHYYTSQEDELKNLEQLIPFIKSEFNVDVELLKGEDYFKEGNIPNSLMPSKPLIRIE